MMGLKVRNILLIMESSHGRICYISYVQVDTKVTVIFFKFSSLTVRTYIYFKLKCLQTL